MARPQSPLEAPPAGRLECVVLSDGTVGDVRVITSLDPTFGLDQEAVRAARQWQFVPATASSLLITVELAFALR